MNLKDLFLIFTILNFAANSVVLSMDGSDIDEQPAPRPVKRRRLDGGNYAAGQGLNELNVETDSDDSDYDEEAYQTAVTESAKKRGKISPTLITSITVKRWPNLWDCNHRQIDFLEHLAAKQRATDGKTLLHLAMALKPSAMIYGAFDFHSESYLSNKIECVKHLVLSGDADFYETDKAGDTPILSWVKSSYEPSACEVQAFYNEIFGTPEFWDKYPDGLDFRHMRDVQSGNTPLHIVCSTGKENVELFKLFVFLGADLTLLGCNGQSILHRLALACPCPENAAIVKYLSDLMQTNPWVKYNLSAIVNVKDSEGMSVFDYVRRVWRSSKTKNKSLRELLESIPGFE